MKRNRKYQFLFLFAVAFFISAVAVSQNLTQPEPDAELERAARKAVQFWEKELGLSSKQAVLMEKKIIEFAIKKNELLLSKMRQEAKIERLRRLQELEHKNMKDILTQLQFDRYIELYKTRVQSQQEKY